MTMTVQYWKSNDGTTWGGMETFKVQDMPEASITDMTQALTDITSHLVSEGVAISDGIYIINKTSSYYLIANRVFNSGYTIV